MNKANILILAAGLSLGLCACRERTETEGGFCRLQVSAAVPGATRITGVTDEEESRVSDIQVFVFDGDGMLETSGSASGRTISLRCRTGEKTVWVVANAPSPLSVSRLSDWTNTVSRLSDNTRGHLVMAGSRSLTVRSDMSGSVELTRLCAKVSVGRITKAFSSSVLQENPLVIDRIYMTNVAADRPFSGMGITLWYNRMGYQGECLALLCDEVGQAANPTLEGLHTFYVYPNDSVSSARGGAWSPRPTRLLIAASLDGERCYYAIDIPGIEGNHSYLLSDIRLSRPGAGDEESVTAEAPVRFTFTVSDWEGTNPYTEYL